MVFYLKYRPRTLKELDNTHVSLVMGKYLAQDTLPHAFLFIGSKGTGKTSTARIVAKSLNCENSKIKGEACGVCDTCLTIGKGDHLDVLEIDAASNRGIDEIRDLREKIKLAPTQLKYKVYIIDEVHMLTTEAFNALLKTLEEPPAHAVFILATTDPHKVPGTIASRCVRIDFGRGKSDDIIHSLKRIVAGEQLVVADDALSEIAVLSDGSFRDAAKLLEELTLDKKKIALSDVIEKIGKTDIKLQEDFLENLRTKKTKELLQTMSSLSDEGKNVRQFFLELLTYMEKTLIEQVTNPVILSEAKDPTRFTKDAGDSSAPPQNDRQPYRWSTKELIQAISLFSKAFVDLKTAVIPTLPFELAVIDYCEGNLITDSGNPGDSRNQSLPSSIVTTHAVHQSVLPISAKWDAILEKVKIHNHSISGVLRSCKPLKLEDNVLTIEAAYKFHAERLSDPKIREIIAQVISEVIGQNVKVEVEIKKRG